jgi:16S rRNA (guanine527-N7)-methyltransferase
MPLPLTLEAIAALLQPYIANTAPNTDWPHVCRQLSTYLDLILKWNARTNLTAIRSPEEIVRRHFGESLFVGTHLAECTTLLDFGSGAGFPGIPIQLLHPEIAVTLAESQGKKAAFLREVARTLNLTTEIWAARVESIPKNRQFDSVVLRAVDDMNLAVEESVRRATRQILILTTAGKSYSALDEHFNLAAEIPLPESKDSKLLIAHRL